MAVLAVLQIAAAGLDPGALNAAAAGGDSFANNGKTFLRVANGHAANPRTVTFTSQLTAGAVPPGTAKTDLAVVVPAMSERWIGPFDQAAFNDPATGRVAVTYSDAAADLTVDPYSL